MTVPGHCLDQLYSDFHVEWTKQCYVCGGGGQVQMACIDFIPVYIHSSVLYTYLPYFGSLDMLENMCVLCLTDGL
jgi:hypothetical protein